MKNKYKLIILLTFLLFVLGGAAYLWIMNSGVPAMNWPVPESIVYGTPLGTNQNAASSSVAGTFEYNPANGTILGVGTHTLQLVFTPADTRHSATNLSVPLVVTPAPLTVTADDQSKFYGTMPPVGAGQNAFTSSGLLNGDTVSSVTLASVGAASGAPIGTYALVPSKAVGSGLTNYSVIYRNGLLTVQLGAPVMNWPLPANIVYGTPLGTKQNAASSSVDGTYQYSPKNGAVLGVGKRTLQVTFTPTDTNYAATNLSVPLVVAPALLAVKANNATRSYGQTNPVFSGTLTGVVNGDKITVIKYETAAVTNSPADSYPITPTLVDPDGRLVNYTVSRKNGILTVTPPENRQVIASVPASTQQPEDKIYQNEVYQNSTNRLALSLRFGLNIHAKFMGIGGSFAPGSTPSGYYDDGYVVTASPPNTSPNPNYTTYWGYDNTSQLVGSPGAYTGVSFNRTTVTGISPDASSGGNKLYPGFELAYDRELLEKENWHDLRFGLEAALNYMKISLNNTSTFGGATASTATDVYQFPIAIPNPPPFTDTGLPLQPALQVPGSSTLGASAATFFTQDQFDADLWGARLGPYVELPLTKNINLRLSGGLAIGLLNGNESWSQTLTPAGGSAITASGGGSASQTLWGYYASLNATWQISKRWAADGALQYQSLGKFDHSFQGRQVELDLSNSLFVELGISFSF